MSLNTKKTKSKRFGRDRDNQSPEPEGVDSILKKYSNLTITIKGKSPTSPRDKVYPNILQQALMMKEAGKPKTIPKEMFAEYTKKEEAALDFIKEFYDPDILSGSGSGPKDLKNGVKPKGFKRRGSIGIRDLGAGYTYFEQDMELELSDHQKSNKKGSSSTKEQSKKMSSNESSRFRATNLKQTEEDHTKKSPGFRGKKFDRNQGKQKKQQITNNFMANKMQKKLKKNLEKKASKPVHTQEQSGTESPTKGPPRRRRTSRAKNTINLGSSKQYDQQYYQTLLNQRKNLEEQLKGMINQIEDPFERKVYSECLPKVLNPSTILKEKRGVIGVRRKSADLSSKGFFQKIEMGFEVGTLCSLAIAETVEQSNNDDAKSIDALDLEAADRGQNGGKTKKSRKKGSKMSSKSRRLQGASDLHFNIRDIFYAMVARSQMSHLLKSGMKYDKMSFFFPNFLETGWSSEVSERVQIKLHGGEMGPINLKTSRRPSGFYGKNKSVRGSRKSSITVKKGSEDHIGSLDADKRREDVWNMIKKIKLNPKYVSKQFRSKLHEVCLHQDKRSKTLTINKRSSSSMFKVNFNKKKKAGRSRCVIFKQVEKNWFKNDLKVQKTYYILNCLVEYYHLDDLDGTQVHDSIIKAWMDFERHKVKEEKKKLTQKMIKV